MPSDFAGILHRRFSPLARLVLSPKRTTSPMNRIRTIASRTVLAIAAIFAAGSAQGDGEVTVVGASWQSAEIPETIATDTSAQPISQPPISGPPVAQSPNAALQSGLDDDGNEFSDECSAFNTWLDGLGCGCWTIDYRYRALVSSGITSSFGTPVPPPSGYAPLSQLHFPINSSWHGIRIGRDEPTWGVHFEWMTPQQSIDGDLSDYDWTAGSPASGHEYTDLGFAQERWVDAQMIDLALDFRLTECAFTLPVEIWPTIGFRWQRFDLTAYNGEQVKVDNQWLAPPDQYPGDVITFSQQFYMGYLGGQFRMRLRSVLLTLQADWGYTWGYNIDHHLDRAGNRFTMESTEGNTWHLGFTAEVPFGSHFSAGFQCDHMEIRTMGTHRLQNFLLGQDVSWDNGVSVSSNQTSLMAFLRFRL
jgi:hypothetical protein